MYTGEFRPHMAKNQMLTPSLSTTDYAYTQQSIVADSFMTVNEDDELETEYPLADYYTKTETDTLIPTTSYLQTSGISGALWLYPTAYSSTSTDFYKFTSVSSPTRYVTVYPNNMLVINTGWIGYMRSEAIEAYTEYLADNSLWFVGSVTINSSLLNTNISSKTCVSYSAKMYKTVSDVYSEYTMPIASVAASDVDTTSTYAKFYYSFKLAPKTTDSNYFAPTYTTSTTYSTASRLRVDATIIVTLE